MAFLVALAVNQDHVVPDVLTLDVADLRVSCACVKGNGKHHLIAGRQEGGVIKGGYQGTHFVIGEGFDQHLRLLLHLDLGGGTGAHILLLDGKGEVGTEAFENTVDVAGRQLLLQEVLNVVFDVDGADLLYLRYLVVLFCVDQEVQGIVVIPFDGSVRQPPELTVQFELLQTVFC